MTEFLHQLRVRWQILVLVVGVVMILAATALIITRRLSDSGGQAPSLIFTTTHSYSEAIPGQPRLVNPLLAVSQADRDLSRLVFAGLTRVDEFGQPVPDLARSWDVSPNGLVYTFYLRPGVTWHDGTPFTAEDVVFTMSLLRDPDFPGPPELVAFWRTVETYAVDDLTVRFVLTQPLAAFPEYAGIGILPVRWLGGIDPVGLSGDPFNLDPIGTGPLQWDYMEKRGHLTIVHLSPYPHFFDSSRRVSLDEVKLYFYPDPDRAFRALGSEVQAMGGLTPSQLGLVLSGSGLNVYTSRMPITVAIIFDQQEPSNLPFFQDENVRLALTLALNRQALVDQVLPQQALPSTSLILPGTWAYDATLPLLPYDPNRADQLLNEAGWVRDENGRARQGARLAFTLLVGDNPVARQLGELIVDQWRAIGVQAELEVLDSDELAEQVQSRNFEAALVEFSQGGLADPDPYPFWHDSQAANGQNYSGFIDRDISEALEIARKDPNGVRRAEEYRNFQRWFMERAAAILLYNPVYHYAVSCQVQGVQLAILTNPSDRFRNMHEWRIVPPEAVSEVCPD